MNVSIAFCEILYHISYILEFISITLLTGENPRLRAVSKDVRLGQAAEDAYEDARARSSWDNLPLHLLRKGFL